MLPTVAGPRRWSKACRAPLLRGGGRWGARCRRRRRAPVLGPGAGLAPVADGIGGGGSSLELADAAAPAAAAGA
eukprot:2007303-Pyramimonas_sp.AAC.1